MSNYIMPARKAFDDEILQVVTEVFSYYRNKNMDFGYEGFYEKKYTDAFVKYMGGEGFADAVCTGTAALYVSIAALQLEPQSQVIVSPITDPGTVSAIILNGLVPVLCDSDPDSYNMSPQEFKSRINNKTKAVVVVHASGKAARIDLISKIAKEHGLYIIEDCSQAHGAKCNGQKVGTFGDIAAFSTMYRKAHATGGCGGVIYTKSEKLYNMVRAYSDRGKPFFRENFDEKDPGTFLFPALNLNIDEISCAIGLKSLERLDTVIKRRLDFLFNLESELILHSKVCRVLSPSMDDSPFFQPVFVDMKKISCTKIEFAMALQCKGISVNPDYKYIVSDWDWVKPYLSDTYDCKNARICVDSSFNILFNEYFGSNEVDAILNSILEAEKVYLL
ncbi:MAG: DegT/DnrJ/EryC1/StrS family aminotransferase [Clostridia bacterium]|nr:DegT/DnrJ/EryC1/StrS family aminotransferase [Clostridia bacterium]